MRSAFLPGIGAALLPEQDEFQRDEAQEYRQSVPEELLHVRH
jgi:hypothetical protein